MGPKKGSGGVVPKDKRKVVRTTIELKKEIIAKYESGVHVSTLAQQYGMAKSTISTFLKNKEAIKEANVAAGVSALSKQRPQSLEEMEKLLLIWIKEKELAGDSVSEAIICEKALQIHEDVVKDMPTAGSSSGPEFVFKASRGWFDKFKHRSGIHNVVRHGEAASSNKDAAESYVKEFDEYVKAEGFLPQQIFNCDETGLFWKKLPSRTYITKEEKALPGHKPMKDRLTLLLCANASGDCKLKPLLVYHSENPRVFKRNNVIKRNLPVMWRSNTKAWVTRQLFIEWIYEVFAPQVRAYLQEKNLPMKCLLVMDNAPAHPPGLECELSDNENFIKIKFLPPNTTPILQPMDQQVISNFKKLYTKALFRKCFEVTNDTQLTLRQFWKDHFTILTCVTLIDIAWSQVTYRTLNSAWKKLMPTNVAARDFEGFDVGFGEEEDVDADVQEIGILDDIVSMGRNMGLEVEAEDVTELVEGHSSELTTEELQHLQEQQQRTLAEDHDSEEDEGREDIPSAVIREMCASWGRLRELVEQYHPDTVVSNRAVNIFNDNVMSHFRKVLQRRQRQQTLDRFLMKRKTPEERQQEKRQRREKTPEQELPFPFMEGDSPSKQ